MTIESTAGKDFLKWKFRGGLHKVLFLSRSGPGKTAGLSAGTG